MEWESFSDCAFSRSLPTCTFLNVTDTNEALVIAQTNAIVKTKASTLTDELVRPETHHVTETDTPINSEKGTNYADIPKMNLTVHANIN